MRSYRAAMCGHANSSARARPASAKALRRPVYHSTLYEGVHGVTAYRARRDVTEAVFLKRRH